MNTLYATFRQIQNSRYTSVDTLDQIFLEQAHAEDYAKIHNELHPKDFLIVKEVPIADAANNFSLQVLTIVKADFTFSENGILKEAFEETKENSMDLSKKAFEKVSIRRSAVVTLGSLKLKEEKKFSFEKEVEPTTTTHYNYTLYTVVSANQTLSEAKESLRKQATEVHQKVLQYQFGIPFLTDHTLEKWLNDPDFSLEVEQKQLLGQLQTFIEQAKKDA